MAFFTIHAYAPIVRQSFDSFHERLKHVTGEQYITDANVGYRTGNFTLYGSPDYLEDWFRNGLARDVVMKGPDGTECFRGWVVQMTYQMGPVQRTMSIEKMANTVNLLYTKKTAGTNQTGRQTLITKSDGDSIALYGTKELIVSGGESTTTTATVTALVSLATHVQPTVGEQVTARSSKVPLIKVRIAGYYYMLDWFDYSNASTGTTTSSALITTVLGDDPNSIFTDTSRIDTNANEAEVQWDRSTARKVIEKTVDRGKELVVGVSGQRWVAQVWEGNALWFKAAEAVDAYNEHQATNQHKFLYRQIFEKGARYQDETSQTLEFWHVRPDRLLFTKGIPGRPMYVQQVQFVPPTSLILSGPQDYAAVDYLLWGDLQ